MLTGKGAETDKVLGLELGADDYVTKPFSPRELVARIKAVLRRNEQKDVKKKITIGDILEIDVQKYQVKVKGMIVSLTPTEFRILEMLAEKKGWVFTRQQILNYLWGTDKAVVDRSIDVHIKNLKKKIGDAREFIKNVRSVGYKLEE
jgi:two-component system phosphate regulon response regulator PhoB/two-component system alkaline phosphatase synthesis response regulator PhoP